MAFTRAQQLRIAIPLMRVGFAIALAIAGLDLLHACAAERPTPHEAPPLSVRPAALFALAAPPPLSPLALVRSYEAPTSPYGSGHRGVDLAGDTGQRVVATLAGRVSFAGSVAGVGVVSVDIGSNHRLTYEPVTPLVTVGMTLQSGDPVGTLLPGHPGCPATACLHWGLVVGEGSPRQYANPMSLLGYGQVRLLPWEDEPESDDQS